MDAASDASRSHPPVPFADQRRQRGWRHRAPGLPWRSRSDRVVTGVAGGVAEWLGISPLLVRVVLAFALVGSGFGLVVYVAAAILLPVSDRQVEPPDRPLAWPQGRDRERALVALAVAVGVSLVLRAVGVWVGGDLGPPAAVAAAGLSLAWSRTDDERRELWRSRLVRLPGDEDGPRAEAGAPGWSPALRVGAGVVLFVAGAGWVVRAAPPATFVPVVGAIAATTGGLALLAGPWVSALWRDLSDERRARIRTEERAEVAAQLHDSVLQTLALIQRHPETTREVAQLARQQERSLRSWLFGEHDGAEAAGSFADRLREAAHDQEDRFGIAVELVVVGDAPADDRTDALVAAVREAVANAARHSGASSISVYAEATPTALSVFVRDRGRGFDPSAVPEDRRGVRESIVGRLARHGGMATVASAPGEGTEVAMELSR